MYVRTFAGVFDGATVTQHLVGPIAAVVVPVDVAHQRLRDAPSVPAAEQADAICMRKQQRKISTQCNQSLLIISPVTRRAATWPLVLELEIFLSNNVRVSTATGMCLRDHNSNNYTRFPVFMTLFRHRTWKSRQIFSFSLQWPGGSTR